MRKSTSFWMAVTVAACTLGSPALGADRTMSSDSQIGDPIAGISPTVEGTTNTYNFGGDNLDLVGHKVYFNAGYPNPPPRYVILTNLTALTDSGSGVIDTSPGGDYASGGPVVIYASSGVSIGRCINSASPRTGYGGAGAPVTIKGSSLTVSGTTNGCSIDAHSGDGHSGGAVRIIVTNGLTLVGGIDASGAAPGNITIDDGAGGSAGTVSIGGRVSSRDAGGLPMCTTAIRGGAVNIASNVDLSSTAYDWWGGGGTINIVGTGPVSINGYLITAQLTTNAPGQSSTWGTLGVGPITITGASVSVTSTNAGGYSLITCTKNGKLSGANITVVATTGDIEIAGGFDASGRLTQAGNLTLTSAGNITVGSLDGNNVKTVNFSVGPGKWMYIKGRISGFAVNEGMKTFTVPAGSVIANNIHYNVLDNGLGMRGSYAILIGTTDSGRIFREGPPNSGTQIIVR